jgi:hypothetical protein
MMDIKIRFSDYVCEQIDKGNFAFATTSCNYWICAKVYDYNLFELNIKPSWFGLSRKTCLLRYTGDNEFTYLKLNKNEEEKLYRAWQKAAEIQKGKNLLEESKNNEKQDQLLWWP